MKKLLEHQITDACWLSLQAFAGNFSGMGSGKTLTVIEAAAIADGDIIIVVCPPIALRMWQAELIDYGHPEENVLIVATGKTPLSCPVLVMSYAIAMARVAELKQLAQGHDVVLILDEAHALTDVEAKRTKAILGANGLCEAAMNTWCLTGTPCIRWNDGLYPFLLRADPEGMAERCGGTSLDKFMLRYCDTQYKRFHPKQRHMKKVVVGSRNTDELNAWLFDKDHPLAIRRELAEVWAAMPPITINRLFITPSKSPELSAALAAMNGMSEREIGKALASNEESMAKTRRLLGTAKVAAAVSEIADRAEAGGGGILVGAWHRDTISALQRGLAAKDIYFPVITGGTLPALRAKIQAGFNDGSIPGIIGQISAMGVAIDLQHGGSNIIVVEEDWSPSIMDQFYARMMRMGQANHVHVDVLVTDTKLDQAIGRISGTKKKEHGKLLAQTSDNCDSNKGQDNA